MEKFKKDDVVELIKEIMDKGACLRFRTTVGASMHPFIRDGDILWVKPVNASEIKIGDVIFYRNSNGGITVHRLIKKISKNGKLSFLTKGDSVSGVDEIIYPEQVQGKVIIIEHNKWRIRIDRGPGRIVGFLWARISMFSPWVYYPFRKIKRLFLKIKVSLKRTCARKIC